MLLKIAIHLLSRKKMWLDPQVLLVTLRGTGARLVMRLFSISIEVKKVLV